MNSNISSFSATIHSAWNGAPYPVIYANGLQAANSDVGPQLLTSGFYSGLVTPQLQELQALGVQAITVHINFPVLYQPYYSNPQDYQSFVSFYQQLAQDVHSRGMKLIVESTVAAPFPGTNAGNYMTYYQGLSWNDYMTGRSQNILNVAQLIQPDYLSVITEPDTEAANSGQTNAGTVSGSVQELQQILSTLQSAGVNTVPIGAGAGTWWSSFTQEIQGVAATGVQYIDIHVYPTNRSYLPNALSAADIAHAAGKQIAVSEAWGNKVRDSELGSIAQTDVQARETFSFWAPIDTSFLQALSDVAQYKQFIYISPFWPYYHFAYLDYNQYGSGASTDIINAGQQAASAANNLGVFTSTGRAWENMILPVRDSQAPSVPTGLNASPGQSTLTLNWNMSTDNVGVAAYSVYRNGSLVGANDGPTLRDQGLTPGTTYSYTVTAFDAAGNVSAASAPFSVATFPVPDTQAPSAPTNVSAVGTSDSQITLSWSPSTDNVAVTAYKVYRGSTAGALSIWASTTTTTFTDTSGVHPATTYYYAVAAADAANNTSAQSPVVAGTSKADTVPPSVPTQLTATPISYTQVNLAWAASTDDIGVAGYKVYRGTAANSLVLMGSTANTSFSDASVAASQTYYYAVASYDAAQNNSAQSAVVAGAGLPDNQGPSIPGNLTGTAVSGYQINLSWSASVDNNAISSYKIYRGTTAQSLNLIASTAGLSYSDTSSITPGKTFYYAVSATDKSGNSSAQSGAIAVTSTADTTPPSTPGSVSGRAASITQINLTWAASTDNVGVVSYSIYRGTAANSLTKWGSSQSTSFSDTSSVAPGTTYYYSITAVDAAQNQSPQSAPVAVTSLADVNPPSVPTAITAQPVSGPKVNLSWAASTDDYKVSTYRVYRGTSANSLTYIGSSTTTAYTDSTVHTNTTYYYSVTAKDVAGNESAQPAPVMVTATAQQAIR